MHAGTTVLELCILESAGGFGFNSHMASAREAATRDLVSLDETIQRVRDLTVDCDGIDYALAGSFGALCGAMDIFLVGTPGKSPIGNLADRWAENRVKDFARLSVWKGPRGEADPGKWAMGFLERMYKSPYDQTGAGDAGRDIVGLTTRNHHFKSLGHNSSLVGLFFSILDQFTVQFHFVSGSELVALRNEGNIELRGHTVVGKRFCGFVNWLATCFLMPLVRPAPVDAEWASRHRHGLGQTTRLRS